MKEQYLDSPIGSNRGAYSTVQDSTEPMVEPEFTFTSSEMNLKYKKFFPFIGAFLIYKFLWKK